MDLAADGELATPGADLTGRPKLLIVDDDPDVRVVVAEFLESFGYSVVQANGGREALDLLPRHPDLRMIISDIRMPDMSGIELVDIATRRQRDLKVILISGYFVSQQIGRRLLSKPFRMRELEAAIRAELNTQSWSDSLIAEQPSPGRGVDSASARTMVHRGGHVDTATVRPHRILPVTLRSAAAASQAVGSVAMMDRHTLSNGTLSATIKAEGAELCSLCSASGEEMLWQAAPIWPRHAPILFPIVGRLKNDTLRHAGKAYRMTQHGFARDRRFAWLSRTATGCRLVLHEDAETRAVYPFAFRLEVAFTLDDDTLEQSVTVSNPGRTALPASLGAHPGFVWPLAEGVEKSAHVLEFAQPETGPVQRLDQGLLRSEPEALTVGSTLHLEPALFGSDALILSNPVSRSVRYSAPGTAAIEVSWQGFSQLGIWGREGGDFLCIEPWHGTASPVDFDGEFTDKPGLMLIPPGDRQTLALRIRLC